MSTCKKILLSASVLLAGVSFSSAASALTLDFTGLTPGSSVSNQYAAQDLNIAAVTTGSVSSAASAYAGNFDGGTPGVTNAPASSNGNYPTDEFLDFTFTTPVNSLSFNFNNIGDNSALSSLGGTFYTAYGLGNAVLSTGSLATVENSLVNVVGANITKLVIDNGLVDTFTNADLGTNWIVSVGSISYNVSSVPLPAGLPMFGAALMGMFGLRRRKEVSAAA